jgi:hypothetical protein
MIRPSARGSLTPYALYHHPLLPASVELHGEDLLAGAEVQLALGYGNHDLAAHDPALDVRVGIVLAGVVVAILARTMPTRTGSCGASFSRKWS